MVTLVSSNSIFLNTKQVLPAVIGGFCISALWWSTTRSVDVKWGWFWYGLGAAIGTRTGMLLAHWQ